MGLDSTSQARSSSQYPPDRQTFLHPCPAVPRFAHSHPTAMRTDVVLVAAGVEAGGPVGFGTSGAHRPLLLDTSRLRMVVAAAVALVPAVLQVLVDLIYTDCERHY